MMVKNSILGIREEEVSRWAWIWEDGSSWLAHTNPTPLDSLYIWAGVSLFTLESGGRVAYIKTHPKKDHPSKHYYGLRHLKTLEFVPMWSGLQPWIEANLYPRTLP
jgi:hypothetical protein